jgi:hypothetical protein
MHSRLLAAVRVGTAGAIALAVASCGYVGSDNDVDLGVPFFAQQLDSFDCGPATVQMWTAFDHGSTNLPTQQQISQFMGGTSLGTSPQKIADAVNFYTATFNAFVDLVAADFETEDFMSRQITSIDYGTPSIAIIDHGFHAVIVVGGSWHDAGNGYRQWDYTYYHDPLGLPRSRLLSEEWIFTSCPSGSTCQQIVDAYAVSSAGGNLTSYGDLVLDSSGPGSTGPYQEF